MAVVVELRAKDESSEPTGGLVDRWKLLQTIIADPALSRGDIALAGLLLDMCGSRGFAYASHETLAERTNQTTRNVKRGVDRLARYFEITKSRGRGHAQSYRPIIGAAGKDDAGVTLSSEKDDICVQERVTSVSIKDDTGVTPTSLIEPVEENQGRKSSLREQRARGDDLFSDHLPDEGKTDRARTSQTTPRNPKAVGDARATDLGAAAFEEWWFAFPAQRRVAKDKCAVLYAKIVKSGKATPATLLTAARDYAASDDAARGFACMPTRWLNEERWTLHPAPAGRREERKGRSLLDAARAALAEETADTLAQFDELDSHDAPPDPVRGPIIDADYVVMEAGNA